MKIIFPQDDDSDSKNFIVMYELVLQVNFVQLLNIYLLQILLV